MPAPRLEPHVPDRSTILGQVVVLRSASPVNRIRHLQEIPDGTLAIAQFFPGARSANRWPFSIIRWAASRLYKHVAEHRSNPTGTIRPAAAQRFRDIPAQATARHPECRGGVLPGPNWLGRAKLTTKSKQIS